MATEWFVWHLWKDGSITQRKAAKLLNLSQKEFKKSLGDFQNGTTSAHSPERERTVKECGNEE